MARSSLPSLRMRDLLSRLLVVMVLVSVVVATDVVPGLRWDRLEIWENSASHDVWTRLSEYVEFRSYVLGALGDLGFLDPLIDDCSETLRSINDIGFKTGFAVAVSAAAVVARVRRRAPGEDPDARDVDVPRNVLSIEEVRIKSINLVSRCLRAGPIKKALTGLVSTGTRSAFNVLNFFVQPAGCAFHTRRRG